MSDVTWRCQHPDGDVKMAAKEEHKSKLEDEGYVCEIYVEEKWLPFPTDSS